MTAFGAKLTSPRCALSIVCLPVRMLRSDNLRAAPLDALQTDVLRALVETLPEKEDRNGQR